ncbi:S41 family peptidase [Oceaniserpentilla sp. 4NH20-0058]|uniref:S41 family peptidase n=1 Tax=Oceaniserpentilla sp. 4NH20-0058 TaxID=3127660 RepID=UPI00333F60AC
MFRSFLFTLLAVMALNVSAQDVIEGEAQVSPSRLPLEELRAFAEIYERIRTSYVETVDDSTLIENAIHGMLNGLDPHSSYLGEEDFEDLRTNTSGKFGGLGIEVSMEDGFIKVVSPIDDTPAQKAGIKAGDLILKLDETPVKGLSLNQAVEKMRGEPGSPIVLTILRDGGNQPLEITIERAEIKITSVKQKLLDEQYGYIRVTQFQENTGADVNYALQILTEKSDQPLSGIILDLRNNPGGVLDAAVAMSDVFIDNGLIVYTQGRLKNADIRYEATIETAAPDIPLIVLINGGSASASEIVAGALQDHGRAIIMGTQSFGKGSVQTVLPLNGDHALKLTTARYYTPSGRSIQAQGITPDIEVHQGKFSAENESRYYKEADLSGHLENPEDTTNSEQEESEPSETKLLTDKDYQLQQALTMLKGMQILNKKATIEPSDDVPAETIIDQ